jgi:hypothetical protein
MVELDVLLRLVGHHIGGVGASGARCRRHRRSYGAVPTTIYDKPNNDDMGTSLFLLLFGGARPKGTMTPLSLNLPQPTYSPLAYSSSSAFSREVLVDLLVGAPREDPGVAREVPGDA